MLRIGITGGIGVGKSFVSKIFEHLGAHIYYADIEAKNLYNTNGDLKKLLLNRFGESIYLDSGINRAALSEIVFNNAKELEWLNAQVHPLIAKHYQEWCLGMQNEPYTLKEAAILFESGTDKGLHSIIGVTCPQELRISRVMERDGVTADVVKAKMAKQMDQEELIKRCQYIIVNDGKQSLFQQVLMMHKLLLSLGS